MALIVSAEKAEAILKMSLDALVNVDVGLAYRVITLNDEADEIKAMADDRIKAAIKQHPNRVDDLINLLFISRHIERLADLATYIAEEVIDLTEGVIIRLGKY